MGFIVETVKPFWDLQGYCDFEIGPLSILSTLYGTGDFIVTCAFAIASRAVAAKMDWKDMLVTVV